MNGFEGQFGETYGDARNGKASEPKLSTSPYRRRAGSNARAMIRDVLNWCYYHWRQKFEPGSPDAEADSGLGAFQQSF